MPPAAPRTATHPDTPASSRSTAHQWRNTTTSLAVPPDRELKRNGAGVGEPEGHRERIAGFGRGAEIGEHEMNRAGLELDVATRRHCQFLQGSHAAAVKGRTFGDRAGGLHYSVCH